MSRPEPFRTAGTGNREMAVVFALIVLYLVVVGALSWWAWSRYAAESLTPFLVVIVPTCVFAVGSCVLLLRAWRRVAGTPAGRTARREL